ncbi:acyl-CoA thioesterase [Bacteroidetes bacterium endosymbiont of Geopemphigus sp.]|uniref:acyl-CoA thioesterase n=1 Tax=Bacteroidetes bacterium endosymbiont of Geopemphigus sp. TaxID=2047937 RepID=UPI000CD32C53|nr:acyl-CoA thioesterase [Bacteroidetes bacterium endosymbiont of Geopemphigus sp.]
MKEPKLASSSLTVMTNVVLPNETNKFSHMFGGELLARIDRVCSIAAAKHAGGDVMTVAVNQVSFNKPIPLGSVVTIEAKVSQAFSTSMEVFAEVFIEDITNGAREKVNEGIYTFVHINIDATPIAVPKLIAETAQEKKRLESASRRRELSLILAGKMDVSKARELKSLFC